MTQVEGNDVACISLGEPFKSVHDSNRLFTLIDCFNGGGTDHAVDSRCRSAPDDDCDFFRHLSALLMIFIPKFTVKYFLFVSNGPHPVNGEKEKAIFSKQ